VATITEWLASLGLSEYAQRFAENDIDVTVLRHLTDQDLKEIGVSLGHRRKILASIAELAGAPTRSQPAAPPEPKPRDDAERRQLTVMFTDLVGSTALSTKLDPEDLRSVIGAYHKCVAQTVGRFGGFVAKYMGDGVLIYFGYPQAHEDDAERAVRAGLALLEAVGKLRAEEPFQVRVGIATGLVVVGDLVGSGEALERGVVGETPNLAARLQATAEPNTVVIAEGTRRLLGNLFELEDLGVKDLKGIAGSVRAWAALRARSMESRFEALHMTGLTILVGREEELELLLRRWARAKTGEGQVVLIAGEAGIGKSRLTAALMESLGGEPLTRLRYFCSPQHTDSALYPIIGQMERGAELAHDDTSQARLDKLDAVLAKTSTSTQDAALFAEMLSLPNDGRYPTLDLTSEQRRQRTLQALISQMEALTRQNPALMIFEDAHWADPTSLEVFGRIVDRIATLPALLIVTFRPEFNPPWIGQPHVTAMTINRLTQREAGAVIDVVVGNKLLPASIRQDIIERTDGIPLFVEEMTKAVLESENEGAAQSTVAAVPSSALAIPASLHASLMARLDRLGPAKEVVQIGAAIGREFSHALLAAVVGKPEAELASALDRLVTAGLLFRHGLPPQATYLFKHALVQDAAYGTLLREPRRALHARIATILEGDFPEIVEAQPELVGQHCSEGGFAEKAMSYWTLAGERSVKRGANREAIRHFRRALQALEKRPETAERSKAELRVLDKLGPALGTVEGWAAPQVVPVYQRARQLARNLGSPGDAVPALIGLWLYHFGRGEPRATHQATQELFEIGCSSGDAGLLLQAHHSAWPTCAYRGDFTAAMRHIEQGLALYDERAHSHHAIVYLGHDPAVCALVVGAVLTCILGYPEQAVSRARAGIELARRLQHAPTLAHALWFMAKLHLVQNNVDAVQAVTMESLALCEEHHLAPPATAGTIFEGWTKARAGQVDDGLRQLRKGLEAMKRGGSRAYLAHRISLLAEVCALAGNWEEASASCEEALNTVHETGDEWFLAKILSQRSELLLNGPRRSEEKAEMYLKDALDVARRQRARWYELRASTSLARLWRDQGKRQQAHDLLAPVYGWFTEGFDTLDLKQAKSLLDELAR
jgi:class 3 adenylate cyclase/predicted ATPase